MKRKKNKIKKNILLIILIIFVLLIILVGFVIYNNYRSKLVGREDYIYNEEESIKYLSERILPRNIVTLNKYSGNVTKDDLYIKLNELANLFININKNMQNSSEEYYNKNKNMIDKYFDNITYEEFEKIVNEVSFEEIEEFKYAEISDDFIALDNYHIFEITFNYKNNQKIICEIYIKNESTNTNKDITFKMIN